MLRKAEAGLNSVEKSRSGELFTEVTSGMADRISWLALTGRALYLYMKWRWRARQIRVNDQWLASGNGERKAVGLNIIEERKPKGDDVSAAGVDSREIVILKAMGTRWKGRS